METETLDALAPYSAIDAKLGELAQANAGKSFDYTKASGIKAAKSHIYTMRQVRGEIERVRKAAKADALEYGRKVDAVAKDLTARVDGMIEVHQKPIDEIDAREEARKARHDANMLKLAMPVPPVMPPSDSVGLQALMDAIATTPINESWEEYEAPARKLRDQTLQSLSDLLVTAKAREAEAAELERLRAEKAAREQAEREAKIAAEAADKAKRAAEEAAKAEAARKELEAQQALEAERAKTAKAAAEAEKAKRDAEEAERKRKAAEVAAKAEADRRAADAAHRAKIIQDAVADIEEFGEITTKELVGFIAEGKVRHVRIEF